MVRLKIFTAHPQYGGSCSRRPHHAFNSHQLGRWCRRNWPRRKKPRPSQTWSRLGALPETIVVCLTDAHSSTASFTGTPKYWMQFRKGKPERKTHQTRCSHDDPLCARIEGQRLYKSTRTHAIGSSLKTLVSQHAHSRFVVCCGVANNCLGFS